MIVNEATGESTLGDTETHVVYTLDAIERVETRLKEPIMVVLERAQRARLTAAEVRAVVQAGMEAYRRRTEGKGPAVTDAAAGAVVEEVGLLVAVAQATVALAKSGALGMLAVVDLAGEAEESGPDPTTGDDSSPVSPSQESSPPTPEI